MNLFEKITLIVPTALIPIPVTFTIVDKLPENRYVLIAQNRMSIAQLLENGTWDVGRTIDLFDLIGINNTNCKQL